MLEFLNREPAFPIWAQTQGWDYMLSIPDDFEPGRVVISGHYNDDLTLREDFIDEHVRPTDIVLIPLYEGDGSCGGPGTSAKLPCYGWNVDAMAGLADRCHGVLIGNAFSELTFKHRSGSRYDACVMAAQFVNETSELAKECGVKVYYGLMDFDAAIDCFTGKSMVRDAVVANGNALITFCGYTMFGGHIPASEPIMHIQDEATWCPNCERAPWTQLSAYISCAEWLTGVGGKSGLLAGNDVLLKEHGFTAGIMGQC